MIPPMYTILTYCMRHMRYDVNARGSAFTPSDMDPEALAQLVRYSSLGVHACANTLGI